MLGVGPLTYVADDPLDLLRDESVAECFGMLLERLETIWRANRAPTAEEEKELRFMLEELLERKTRLYTQQ